MDKLIRFIKDFLFYAFVTAIVTGIFVMTINMMNPVFFIFYLYYPFAIIFIGIIGGLIGLKWKMSWVKKFIIALLLVVPIYFIIFIFI